MDKHTTGRGANSIEGGTARVSVSNGKGSTLFFWGRFEQDVQKWEDYFPSSSELSPKRNGCSPFRRTGNRHARMKPLPKISLELVTRMNAWGSADFR